MQISAKKEYGTPSVAEKIIPPAPHPTNYRCGSAVTVTSAASCDEIGKKNNFRGYQSVFCWYLNPYVRFNFFQMDRLSLFADATGNFEANHSFDVIYIGLRPGISYQLTDCFTAVAHLGFIGSYNHDLRAEMGLNNLEFSLYYLFDKKK